MFKRNGSALRQLLILQRNYLRLYLIETFLSGQVIIHYLLNYPSSNLSKPNTTPYKYESGARESNPNLIRLSVLFKTATNFLQVFTYTSKTRI